MEQSESRAEGGQGSAHEEEDERGVMEVVHSGREVEEDEEEEEFYIPLEFVDYQGTNLLQTFKTYSLIGLETSNPILKLDNTVYQGAYEHIIGTHLYFERPPARVSGEGANEEDNEDDVRYVCSAQKKLVFRKIDLIPKDTVMLPKGGSGSQHQHKSAEQQRATTTTRREEDEEDQPAFYVTVNEPQPDR